MSKTGWKAFERSVAARLGGERYWANVGGRVDVRAPGVLAQCKEWKVFHYRELEKLAVEMDGIGQRQGMTGILVVKRSAGRGTSTVPLVILTLDAWCR